MTAARRILSCLPFAAALVFVACGDDEPDSPDQQVAGASHAGGEGQGGADSHAEGAPECLALGSLCHEADTGPGAIEDCHQLGHEGEEQACQDEFASCITVCVAEEGGAGGAPATVTNPYCQALGELCHFVNDVGTPTGECHEMGHEGKEAACIAAFADCVPLCLEKRNLEPDPHTEGGAGGMSGDHTEAGMHGGGALNSAGGAGAGSGGAPG